MKKLILVFAVIFCFGVSSSYAQKVAAVDLQRAMITSEAGAKAAKDLQNDRMKAEEKLNKMKAEIDAIRKDLETQKSVLTPEVVQKKQADIQKKGIELERFVNDTQNELRNKEAQLFNPILQSLAEVVRKYGEEKKLDFIYELGSVLYSGQAMDVTDEIIKRFNAQWKSGK